MINTISDIHGKLDSIIEELNQTSRSYETIRRGTHVYADHIRFAILAEPKGEKTTHYLDFCLATGDHQLRVLDNLSYETRTFEEITDLIYAKFK